jgi:hypothetical protein
VASEPPTSPSSSATQGTSHSSATSTATESTRIGLHRESTGLVYFRNSHTQGVADNQFFFGDPGDRLVAGDWTGDGIDSPGLFRPGNHTVYLRYANTQGNADESKSVGSSSWLPVAGFFGTPEKYLTQLDPVSGSPDSEGAAAVSGRLYRDSFQARMSSTQEVTYLLSGLYDRFTAMAGIRDDAAYGSTAYTIEIFDGVSGAPLWSGSVSIGSPKPIDISVAGVLRLRILMTRTGGSSSDYVVLGDAKVGGTTLTPPTGDPLNPPPPAGRYLIDLNPVYGSPDTTGQAQISGTNYLKSFQARMSSTEEVTYLLSGLYDKFTAMAGIRDDAAYGSTAYTIQILDGVSGTQLWSGSVTAGSPLPVDISVSGVLRLRRSCMTRTGGGYYND